MKKIAKWLLIASVLVFAFVALVACGKGEDKSYKDSEIYQVYLAYAENGGTLSYDEWYASIKGEKGDPGEKGDKGDKGDTGAKGDKGDQGIQGDKGDDGLTPTIEINADGYWVINGEATTVKAQGEQGIQGDKGDNGLTPYIGENGNWWIGEEDTGTKASSGEEKGVFFTGKCGENATWTMYVDGSLIISGQGEITSTPWSSFSALITKATIEDGIENIPNYAFSSCSSLTSITIPDSVTSIGEYAFSGCSSLRYNEYDNGYYLGNDNNPYIILVKAKDTSITSCTIHEDTKFIYSYAFYECSSLTSVYYTGDIASWCGITFSGYYSNPLRYAHNLYINNEIISGEIVLPNTVTQIPDYTFRNSNITSIIIPDSVTSIGSYAFYECSNLTSVYYTGDIASWCGITFSGYSSNPLIYVHNLYIDNELIKDIVIPDTVTEIKAYAFHGWNGTSITIPDSVTSIGEEAFSYCSSLQYNEYDNGYYLGNDNNPYIILVKAKDTSITSCTIHENTKFIHSSAFYNCSSLTSITIPDSVTSIGNSAFSFCYSLTSITFQGTKAQWYAISKGYDWNYNTGSYVVYCTDGDIR